MKVTIETIPHSAQRYDTCGDWTTDAEGNLFIRVSEMADWRLPMLVAVHELVEALLCKAHNITAEMVDEFDLNWKPPSQFISEPGSDTAAPYYNEHHVALYFERMLAADLEVNWRDYETALNALER